MSVLFLISDTHFGHKKILEFEKESRPFSSIEEHDEFLISNWNRTVGKKDVVWHLGDVLFGASSFSVIHRLNGIKRLILGNHDTYPSSRYLEFFNSLHGSAEVRGYILSHIPIHESQFRRAKGNIHGHLHSRKICDARYINVSADQINLTPIAFDSLPPAGSP